MVRQSRVENEREDLVRNGIGEEEADKRGRKWVREVRGVVICVYGYRRRTAKAIKQ